MPRLIARKRVPILGALALLTCAWSLLSGGVAASAVARGCDSPAAMAAGVPVTFTVGETLTVLP